MDNFIYACVQVAHNIGAVIVVAAPIIALLQHANSSSPVTQRLSPYYVLTGWLLQIASGIGFGITSYMMQGHVPQIESVASVALYIKISCAVSAIILTLSAILQKSSSVHANKIRLRILLGLGVSALFSAAFLRWYG